MKIDRCVREGLEKGRGQPVGARIEVLELETRAKGGQVANDFRIMVAEHMINQNADLNATVPIGPDEFPDQSLPRFVEGPVEGLDADALAGRPNQVYPESQEASPWSSMATLGLPDLRASAEAFSQSSGVPE